MLFLQANIFFNEPEAKTSYRAAKIFITLMAWFLISLNKKSRNISSIWKKKFWAVQKLTKNVLIVLHFGTSRMCILQYSNSSFPFPILKNFWADKKKIWIMSADFSLKNALRHFKTFYNLGEKVYRNTQHIVITLWSSCCQVLYLVRQKNS